jgi:acyl-CoA synthetase (AMP-forming)/AMP-acid ligase II
MRNSLIEAVAVEGEVHQTIPDMIRHQAIVRGAQAAIHDGDRTISWAMFGQWVDLIATTLRGEGLRPGDTVASLAETTAEHLAVYFGTLAAGGCMVPLPTSATTDATARMASDSGARILFVTARLKPQAEAIEIDRRISLDFTADGWHDLESWLWQTADPSAPAISPDDDFDIIYSSGTTGRPKGIIHDHRFRTRQVTRMANYGMDSDTVNLVSTPLYSNTTLVSALPALALGGCLVLMRKFDAHGFLELAQKHHVTHTMLVPVQYERLLALPDFDTYDLSAFRLKLCTSAPLRESVTQDILRRWPGRLVNIYGMTEGGISTALDTGAFPAKLRSVGRPVVGADLRLIDEQGQEVAPGETGEVIGRSRTMMRGYKNAEDLTRQALWFSPEGEAFIRSGDIGRLDQEGFLYLLDRQKDMIISGGFNVYACDLEEILLAHPAVSEAAVVAIPSEKWGEAPLGLVVLKPDHDPVGTEILVWANARLGNMQRLSDVEIRASFPRSAIGKVLKRELRNDYWSKR